MEQSLYLEQIKNDFANYADRVAEQVNGKLNTPENNYLHKVMLEKEYSPDLKWGSLSVSESIVAADVVAMDSSIPLKSRDQIGKATGDVPKQAIEYALREKELTDLGILARTPGRDKQLLRKLFNDTKRVILGQYERNEFNFLQGLSTGVTLIDNDSKNTGLGIRVDYGYKSGNKFGVPVVWSNTSSTPFTDIKQRILAKAKADGNTITVLMMDQTTFDNIAKTTEARQLFAFSQGFTGSTLPIPNLDQVNTMTKANYRYTIQIVDRSVRFQKDGVNTNVTPWQAGMLVALTSNKVGRLVWGTLAEMENPVPQAKYTTVDEYILVSKFSLNRPSLAEFTNSQALVLPVIDNVDQVYTMDSTTVQA